jgi:N-acetylmuramic acid 6-phosphate (MurNAc-6-P) etherase
MKIKTARRKETMMRKMMTMVSSRTKKKMTMRMMRILREATGMLRTLSFKLLSALTNSKMMAIMDLLQVKEKGHNQRRVEITSHRIDQPTTKRI